MIKDKWECANFLVWKKREILIIETRPSTRRKMRLAGVWEEALRMDGRTDGHTLL